MDRQQDLSIHLEAIDQMSNVGLTVPRASVASAFGIQRFHIFLEDWFSLGIAIVRVADQSLLLLSQSEGIVDFENADAEFHGVSNIFNFSHSSQSKYILLAFLIFLSQSFLDRRVYLLSLRQGLCLAYITNDKSIDLILQDLLKTSVEKRGVFASVNSSQ